MRELMKEVPKKFFGQVWEDVIGYHKVYDFLGQEKGVRKRGKKKGHSDFLCSLCFFVAIMSSCGFVKFVVIRGKTLFVPFCGSLPCPRNFYLWQYVISALPVVSY